MIEAVYDRKALRVTVKGHAGSAEAGHDLVCAGASTLVLTLASNVMGLCAEHERVRRPKIRLDEGDAEVSCSPVHGMRALTEVVFDSVCSGFDILQQKYPQYLSYKVVG